MTVREFFEDLKKGPNKMSNKRIAKQVGISSMMVGNYLKGNVTPYLKIAKRIYQWKGIVVEPYLKEEVDSKHEQQLMEFEDGR